MAMTFHRSWMDDDLQHPPELILEMLAQWESGFEVVLARRTSRETDQPLQRLTQGLARRQ